YVHATNQKHKSGACKQRYQRGVHIAEGVVLQSGQLELEIVRAEPRVGAADFRRHAIQVALRFFYRDAGLEAGDQAKEILIHSLVKTEAECLESLYITRNVC